VRLRAADGSTADGLCPGRCLWPFQARQRLQVPGQFSRGLRHWQHAERGEHLAGQLVRLH